MTDPGSLIRHGTVDAVKSAARALDEAGRTEWAARLPAILRARGDEAWQGREAMSLAVVVAGCAPSAAKAHAMLGAVLLDAGVARVFLEVADERGVGWVEDLGRRVAKRLSRSDPWSGWDFAAALLRHVGAEPPADDAFVVGWVQHALWYGDRSGPLVGELRADPFLPLLAPRLFEVEGIGRVMAGSHARFDGKLPLPHALAALAAEGLLSRGMLLDGCLGRMLRGGTNPALRPFVALHDLLAPTAAEAAAREGDYLRLLAAGPPQPATMAQRVLRASEPSLDAVLEVSREALARAEKALVRTQLAWLAQLAARNPARVADILAVVAVAASHPAIDIRDRAAELAAELAAEHRAAPVGGPAVAAAVAVAVDTVPPLPAPAAAPPPITEPDELAEEFAAVVLTLDRWPDAMAFDRLIDGVVRLAAADPAAAARALEPVTRRNLDALADNTSERGTLRGSLAVALSVVAFAEPRRGMYAALLRGLRPDLPAFESRWPLLTLPAPQAVVLMRLAEIGAKARSHPRAGLLAAPVWANGSIDALVLVERLAALGGAEPWPGDLAQAMLRLPAGVDEEAAARAEKLGTRAGDRVAAWLRRGGLPAPVVEEAPVTRPPDNNRSFAEASMAEWRLVVTAKPADPADDLFGLLKRRAEGIDESRDRSVSLWPAVVPGYRHLAAVWLLPHVAGSADKAHQAGAGALLSLLAECGGEGGPAVDLALAYGLAARAERDRVAAVDAVLTLTASHQIDGTAVGSRLGELARRGVLKPSRCMGPLRDAAAAGARLTTWRMLAAALPTMLAGPRPPPGTPDLLTLAAELAPPDGAPGLAAVVAEVAARRGSTRLVAESRRLAAALSR